MTLTDIDITFFKLITFFIQVISGISIHVYDKAHSKQTGGISLSESDILNFKR